MYAEERQQAIAALVAQSGRVSVAELSRRFSVTTETVRRDLSTLERAGLVRRVHGGVVAGNALSVIERAVTDRDRSSMAEKDRIAAAALEFLPERGSVLVDAGTTTARLAGLIPAGRRPAGRAAASPAAGRRELITHAVRIAARLPAQPAITLRMLPGRVRPTTQAA